MKKSLFLVGLILVMLSACSGYVGESDTPQEPQTLNVMTHDSFAVSDAVLEIFQQENNVIVKFIQSGDTGTAVNAAVLAAGRPIADVFYGVDNTFLSRALESDIFEVYSSPQLEYIPQEFQLDPQQRALPVDFGDVCLNFDRQYFLDRNLLPPQSLEDLLLPQYAGMLAVPNPASSSPGLAFLMTTIGHFGEEGYLDYWRGLAQNDLQVVNDWETVYYSEFSRWGGTRPVVVSYSSSPTFEILFAEEPMDVPPTDWMAAEGACYRQIEFVGILKGTEKRALAEKWVDFMLSTPFQEDMPLQMYVFPVNLLAELDQSFMEYMAEPLNPVMLDFSLITQKRETWINDWREAVFQ